MSYLTNLDFANLCIDETAIETHFKEGLSTHTVSFPFLVGQMLKYYVIKILGFNCKERKADKSLRSSLPAMTKEVYFTLFFLKLLLLMV